MAHAGKLISCLEKYNSLSKQMKRNFPAFCKLISSKIYYGKEFTHDLDSYAQQGSVEEGSCGLYNVNPDIQYYIWETDIMYYSPSFLEGWRAKQKSKDTIIFCSQSGDEIPNEMMLTELEISARFEEQECFQCVIKHLLGRNTQIEICPIVREKDGKSIKYHILHVAVKVKQRIIFEIHCDFVIAGKFQEWPSHSTWLQTEGKWPCHLMRQKISKKVNIRAVAAQKGARCSYSELEAELFSLISTPQRNAFVIFKCMFYCHVRPLLCDKHRAENEDPFFTSYLAKTTFLLACENHPPDDVVWQDLDLAVQLLLKHLLQYFEQGMLPHFARNHNLFEEKGQSHNYLECNILQLGIEQVSKMVMNFERYLPDERRFKKLVRLMSLIHREYILLLELLKSVKVATYIYKLCYKYMLKQALLGAFNKLLFCLRTRYDMANLVQIMKLLN